MKRHPSLAPLSREHHGALILARLLQKDTPAYKGLPADTAGKAIYALNFYQEELIKHFEEEEKVLKLVTGVNAALDLLMETIFHEHEELHLLFQSINNHPDIATHLDKLGIVLNNVKLETQDYYYSGYYSSYYTEGDGKPEDVPGETAETR